MKVTVMGIKLKNLLFVLVFIVSILIMSNYFQQIMEAYIKNSILRWGIGIVLSFVMLHILYNNPLFKVDSNHKELTVSEENIIKQNELYLLDEQSDEFSSTPNSVFRLHFTRTKEPTYVDGWLVIDENMNDQTGRDMVGYIPVDTITGAPTFISSYVVDGYDYLYEKPKPKLAVSKAFSIEEELIGSLLPTEKEQDFSISLNKEIANKHSIIRTKYGYVEQLNTASEPSFEMAESILSENHLCPFESDEIDVFSMGIFQGTQLKTVPFFKAKAVFQTTMREVSEPFIFEKNIIEIFSENAKDLEKAVKEKLWYLRRNQKEKEILEIGPKQLFKSSIYMPIDDLYSVEDKPYGKLNEISDADVQVVVVYSEELLDAHGVALLSDIAHSSNELRLILFLTIGSRPSILPILNFTQVHGQPIINVIDFKKYYEKDVRIIEDIYKSIMFNLMT